VKYLAAVVILAFVGVAVAAWLLFMHAERGVPCPDRVVILRGRGGAPVECVCVDGALATCFAPGP
jgi:hypothetical protein